MDSGFRKCVLYSLGLLMWVVPLYASAQQWGESVNVRGPVKEDLYLAGGQVEVAGGVEGDVSAAGGRVTIDDSVIGDVAAFGGTVHVNANVSDDIRLTGGEVTVSGQSGDDLLAAGGTVTVTPGSRIRGRAWLAGGRVEMAGRVGQELRAAGGEIVIAGEVQGDVELIGENIEIRPGTMIRGQLRYRSPNPARIDPEAKILGPVVAAAFEMPRPRAGHTGGRIFVTLSVIVTAALLYLLFPGFSLATARAVRVSPWANLGIGFAILAGGPLVVILLFASLLGLWLGLIALALYLVLLLLGYLTGALFLADRGLALAQPGREHGRWWVIAALAAVLILLCLLRLVPVLGGLVSFVLMLFGLGALGRALWGRYSTPAAKPRGRATVKRRRRT